MTIPRERGPAVFEIAIRLFLVLSVLAALVTPCVSLWLGGPCPWLSLAASLLWLFLVAFFTLQSCRDAGGLDRYLINIAAGLCGRLFAEISAAPPLALELGVYLLGRRFVQRTIPLDSIETVSWSTGQATSMAGYDRNDWHVCVWFDHAVSAQNEKQRRNRLHKPDQENCCIGPSRHREKTTAFGLSLVAFLRAAGTELVGGPTPNSFVRRQAAEG